jgi:uncharacterized membrane protein
LLIPIGGAAVLMTACKWAVYDTLVLRVVNGPGADLPAVANWQFAAGLAIGAALLAFVAMVRRRSPADWSDQVAGGEGMRIVRTAIGIFAAVLLVYAGSFEIDRYFHGSAAGRWSDPHQAMQTAWSVWWAVYATALMALGFALRIRAVRYLALVIFAVALTKVLAVDMAKVETVYRILSFLCLGTLLVAASWLYHRFFREKAAG